MAETLHNPTAGEILKDLLDELNLSQNELARGIDVPPNRINSIIRGLRSVTANTDLRLCKFFGLSEGFFLRLQSEYELKEAEQDENLQNIVANIRPYRKPDISSSCASYV